MIKLNKRAVRITAATLAAALIFGTVAALAAIKPEPDSYTVYADDGYYSETTYYLTEEAYNEHSAENAPATTQTRSTKQAMSSSQTENDDEQFVVAAEKTVWVEEISDENGALLESKLLSKQEIQDIKYFYDKNKTETVKEETPKIIKPVKAGINTLPEEEIGSENQSYYNFTMTAIVRYNNLLNLYYATTTFSWQDTFTFIFDISKQAETQFRDCVAITWGGDENFVAQEHRIQGTYYDNSAMEYIQCDAEPTLGYAWEFHEQKNVFEGNKELKEGIASVTLKKKSSDYKNKQARVKFTYLHTYGALFGEIKVGIDKNGLEGALTITGSEDYWNMEIAIYGLNY